MSPRKSLFVLGATLATIVSLIAAPVITLPYQGDDIENHAAGNLSWADTVHQAWAMNQFWMQTQGRFFPTAAAYASIVWHAFPTVTSYHLYISALLCTLMGLILVAMLKLMRPRPIAIVAFLVAITGLQYRYWWVDGVSNMSGQIVFSAILAIAATAACALFLRDRQWRFGIAACGFWMCSITIYEVALLLLPAFLLLTTCQKRRFSPRELVIGTSVLTLPTIALLFLVLYLRSNLAPSTLRAEFTISLHGPVIKTTLKQFLSALPSSQYLFGGVPSISGIPSEIEFPWLLTIGIAAVLAIPLLMVLVPEIWRSRKCSMQWIFSIKLIAAGVWIWIVPSLLVGINGRWQTDLPVGQGYIYSFYETLGLGLIVGAFLLIVSTVCSSLVRKTVLTVFLCVALSLAAGTVASNYSYSEFFR